MQFVRRCKNSGMEEMIGSTGTLEFENMQNGDPS